MTLDIENTWKGLLLTCPSSLHLFFQVHSSQAVPLIWMCSPPGSLLSLLFSNTPSEFICFPSSKHHLKLVNLQSGSMAWISHLETSLSLLQCATVHSSPRRPALYSRASLLNQVPSPHLRMIVLFWFFQSPNRCPLLPLPTSNLLPEPIVLPWLSLGSTSSLALCYPHCPAHCYQSRSLPSFRVDLPSFREVLLSWHSWHPGRRVRDSPARRLPGLGPCVVYSVYMA